MTPRRSTKARACVFDSRRVDAVRIAGSTERCSCASCSGSACCERLELKPSLIPPVATFVASERQARAGAVPKNCAPCDCLIDERVG